MANGMNLNFNQPFNTSEFLAGGSGANNQSAPSGGGGWLSTLLGGAEQAGQYVGDNPNLQQALAQMGAEIDPQGFGGTVGRATSGMIQRQGQQAMMKQLLDALGEGGKVKQGPDGTVEMTKGKESEGDKSTLAGPIDQMAPGVQTAVSESWEDEDAKWMDDLLGGID